MKANAFFFLGFTMAVLRLLTPAETARAQTETLSLNAAIIQSAQTLESRLTRGVKLVVLNFGSTSDVLSEYVVEELINELRTNTGVTVIERQTFDIIRKEINLQLSGEVDDDSAASIGKQLGSQSIVTGSLTPFRDVYRFRVRAINTETARLEMQVSYNLGDDRLTTILLNSGQKNTRPVITVSPPAVTPPQPSDGNRTVSAGPNAPRKTAPAEEFQIRNAVLVKYNGKEESVTVPANVTSIKDWAFFRCADITSITLPDGLTSIGDCAFWECDGLTSVSIPASVTAVGDYAFAQCGGLTSVTLSRKTAVGENAFPEDVQLSYLEDADAYR